MLLYFLLQKFLLSKSSYNTFFPYKSMFFFFFFLICSENCFFFLRFSNESGYWGRNGARKSQKASFSGGLVVKDLPSNAGDVGSILELGRSLRAGNGNPLQYSCLGNLRQRSLGGCSSWVHKESNMMQWLDNNNNLRKQPIYF